MSLVQFDHKGFFTILQNDLGKQVKVGNWLQRKLGLSKTSAYARINGQTPLSSPELLTIIAHAPKAGQLASSLYKPHPLRLFQLNQFKNADEFDNYLKRIEELFNHALRSPNFSFQYVARDLPIFYFFSHPLLLRYKLSEWTGTPRAQGLPSLHPNTLNTAKRLWERYQEMPTTELWNPLCGQRQWLMLHEEEALGGLHPTEAEEIRQVFRSLYARLERWIKQQHKSGGGPLQLYSTKVFTLNNGARLRYAERDLLLGTIHNAQHFDSNSSEMIDLFEQVWNRHMEIAKGISPGSPNDQQQFMQLLRRTE